MLMLGCIDSHPSRAFKHAFKTASQGRRTSPCRTPRRRPDRTTHAGARGGGCFKRRAAFAWSKSKIARWRVVVVIKASPLRPARILISVHALLGAWVGRLGNVAPTLFRVNVIAQHVLLVDEILRTSPVGDSSGLADMRVYRMRTGIIVDVNATDRARL